MKYNSEPGTYARKVELINKRDALAAQIINTVDQGAASKLRADYRQVLNELVGYYDDVTDVTEGASNE